MLSLELARWFGAFDFSGFFREYPGAVSLDVQLSIGYGRV